jgi:hypothetical protein
MAVSERARSMAEQLRFDDLALFVSNSVEAQKNEELNK